MRRHVIALFQRLQAHPITSLLLAGLVVLPGTALLTSQALRDRTLHPSVAPGTLQRISESMRMLQSFRVDASKPAPALWTRHFDPTTASDLWTQLDGQIWWQAWPQDGDPLLILPEPDLILPSATAPLRRQQDGLVLVFSDLLNAVSFDQQVQPSRSLSTPLEQTCFDLLHRGSAVLWTPAALASIAGPLLPLLQQASYGCVSLELKGSVLSWSGVVGSRPFQHASTRLTPPDRQVDLPPLRSIPATTDKAPEPGSDKASEAPSPAAAPLLELSSWSSRMLLGAMLNRSLIRDGLEEDYGLPPTLQLELLDAPLLLQVNRVDKGPFQAGVQLDLQLPNKGNVVTSALNKAADRLLESGLSQREQPLTDPDGRAQGRVVLWYEKEKQAGNDNAGGKNQGGKNDERLLGGWTWLAANASKNLPARLRLTLASAPDAVQSSQSLPMDPASLSASMQPLALNKLGLLGSSWPKPVRQSQRLDLVLQPLKGAATNNEDWSWMRGQLAVPGADSAKR